MTRRVSALGQVAFFAIAAAVPVTAATRYVAPGESIQRALNEAVLGDTIVLQAGATYTGNFILPNKTSGTGWITVQSSLVDALPAAGQRIKPSDAPNMAKIMSPNGGAPIATADRAHHYKLVGLEIAARPGIYTNNLITLGSSSQSLTETPHSFVLDRLYVHGDPKSGIKRGISLNSKSTTITNSWVSDIKSTSQDSQAICGWNGPGPFHIENNYLEASGENIMFGGAGPSITNLVPSDITIRRNHLFKPLSWKVGDPTFAGTTWIVKNLFELKNARRVTLDGNVFENNWRQAQIGFAILFTAKTDGGATPWAVVEDVVFSNNVVRNAAHGINIMGGDSYGGDARRITIRSNVFEDIDGRFLQVINGANDVTVDHNTIFQSGTLIVFDNGTSSGFVFKNNLSGRGDYGIKGSGRGEGISTLTYYTPGSVVTRNMIGGAASTIYPAGNYFPGSISDARFMDMFGGNYTLAADSPYRAKGTDGKDLGADFAAVKLVTTGVKSR